MLFLEKLIIRELDKMIYEKDFLSGIFFLALGLVLAFKSTQFPVWSGSGPQAGFFPLLVAVLMIGVSFCVAAKSFLGRGRKEKEIRKEEKQALFESSKFIYYVVLMLVYSLSIESIGFLFTSILFLILVIKFVEKQSWRITFLVGSASIIASYILFVYFLGVPLPKGLMKWV